MGAMLTALNAQAQITVTTSTNAVPSPMSTPTLQPDTLQPTTSATMPKADKKSRNRRKKGDTSNSTASDNAPSSGSNDARQGAVSAGTSINSSNTTNYNTNNAVAPATGIGASPASQKAAAGDNTSGSSSMSGTSTTTGGSTTSGSTMGTSSASPGNSAVSNAPTPGDVADPNRSVVGTGKGSKLSVGDYIAATPNHITLQNALQLADLDATLKGSGSYTVFAPTNSAFKTLPAATQKTLLEGQNRAALKQLLSYHVVKGSLDSKELKKQISASNGKARLQTLAGSALTAQLGSDGRVSLTDEQGNVAYVEAPDQYESNGIVHSIDKVLMPKGGTTSFK